MTGTFRHGTSAKRRRAKTNTGLFEADGNLQSVRPKYHSRITHTVAKKFDWGQLPAWDNSRFGLAGLRKNFVPYPGTSAGSHRGAFAGSLRKLCRERLLACGPSCPSFPLVIAYEGGLYHFYSAVSGKYPTEVRGIAVARSQPW